MQLIQLEILMEIKKIIEKLTNLWSLFALQIQQQVLSIAAMDDKTEQHIVNNRERTVHHKVSIATPVIALNENQKTGQRWRLQIQNWCDVGKARGKWPRQTPARVPPPASPSPRARRHSPRTRRHSLPKGRSAASIIDDSDQRQHVARLPLNTPRPISRCLAPAVAHLLHFIPPLCSSYDTYILVSCLHSLGGFVSCIMQCLTNVL